MQILLLSLGLGSLSHVPGIADRSVVAFIPTAGRPYEEPTFVEADRRRLNSLGYQVQDVDPSTEPAEAARNKLTGADWIFVAGGNTFYLLQELRRSGLADAITDLVRSGVPYVGASAGAAIAGPSIEPLRELDDPKQAPDLNSYDGLGLVPVVVLPHYGKEKYMPRYRAVLDEYSERFQLEPLTDEEALLFTGAGSTFVKIASEVILEDA